MKPEQGWCIKSPDGQLIVWTTEKYGVVSVSTFCKGRNVTWGESFDKGYACVKVEVREVES